MDVTKGLDVSWQVNGDSPMTDYQITIYQNDTASTQMYTTGQVTLVEPFQTHDVQGNPMFFSTTISAATLATAGIVNGYANGYKMIIKQWWGADSYVEQTSASVFITRTTPTLSLDAIPNPVATSKTTITASYSQAQGDPISTVEWIFALAGLEDTPIKQTGAINTQVLSFEADGLITGNTYSIMCSVVTASGMEVSTGYVQFQVSYPSSSIDLNYRLAQMKNSSAVYLNWDRFSNNILPYPYADSTKTTNGITFTVNGEGDVEAFGTATADAYFTLAQGTISQIGIASWTKIIITSGYSGARIEIEEKNQSNVVVSSITGNDPLQYIVPETTNSMKISVVIPSGTAITGSQQLKPMFAVEEDIVTPDSLSISINPIQDLHGYASPWGPGGGNNLVKVAVANNRVDGGITYTEDEFGTVHCSGTATAESFSAANVTSSTADQRCIRAIPAGTYTIANIAGARLWVQFRNADNTANLATATNVAVGSSLTKTFSEPVIIYIRSDIASGTVIDADMQVMVTAGSTAATVFEPYQNICPITGSTSLTAYRIGKNKLPKGTPGTYYANGLTVVKNADGTLTITGTASATTYILAGSISETVLSVGDILSGCPQGGIVGGVTYYYLQMDVDGTLAAADVGSGAIISAVGTNNRAYIYIRNGYEITTPLVFKPMVRNPSTDAEYEPYNRGVYSVNWYTQAGTVYGGTLDAVSGELIVDRIMLSATWGSLTASQVYTNMERRYLLVSGANVYDRNLDKRRAGLCNVAPYDGSASGDYIHFFFNGGTSNLIYLFMPIGTDADTLIQFCYYIATPITYQLTPALITLLQTTSLWSTGENVTIGYTKQDGTSAVLSGQLVTVTDSNAKDIPTPQYIPGIESISIYRYFQGEPVLRRVYDFSDDTNSLLDYYVPSQTNVSYLVAAHSQASDLFGLTDSFSPVFWFYSILLCDTDSSGTYHVRKEYIFKYNVETGAMSNNNSPSLQQNFTRYPTRQPVNSLYKTGTIKGYIGTVSDQKIYRDSVSLQNAIYEISTSTLTKFLKTRKGETIMVECSAPIQMQTGDNMREQPLAATIDWVEVGDTSEISIVSIPSDSFWPM